MADKVTLDFENNIITWDTDTQQGTEFCPDLSKRKPEIIKAMGYKVEDIMPVVKIFEAMVNGQISNAEADRQLRAFIMQK